MIFVRVKCTRMHVESCKRKLKLKTNESTVLSVSELLRMAVYGIKVMWFQMGSICGSEIFQTTCFKRTTLYCSLIFLSIYIFNKS